ncbi:AarF/ABC1/UbiB kinase family protein [Clostridium sp.]|jgi:ubiquinone biosynthesis protein|uniref:ABC1 kinase family protein n=1 Tax=Clostridium sp. TaxID=1506 RepID=UPI002584AD70|nr:AarF/ABC1/UbiB kinase family protein [Clostridium sp.]MDF2503565.1 putative unusual protein kinase [Clostridium sp.]
MHRKSVYRLKEIVKVLAYYGFGFIVDSKLNGNKKSPKNLRKAFEELGPTFIKIGQILSTRPDLLPDPYIKELSKLQNNVSPEDFNNIEQLFFNEFNDSIENTFLYFDKNPIGSASIAQVYDAILKDGRFVIVKIQRPGIAEEMKTDLSIISKLINITKARFTDALIDPKEALDELIESTKQELDFKNELNNINKFKKLNHNVDFVYTPYTIDHLCNEKILTMEKIVGYKIDNLPKLLSEGYDLDDLGRKLALSYFKQVFEDGFFHGDPHPGNLLIEKGHICYIDFGIMGTISKSLKSALNEAMIAIAYNDVNKIISVIMSIGVKKGYVNRNSLYESINYLFDNYMSTSLKNIKISIVLQEIFEISKNNNIKLPKELTMLLRSMLIIEGVITKISPDLSMINIVIPYVKSQNKNLFFKNFDLDSLLLRGFKFVKSSSELPSKFIELSDSLITGRAKIQLQHTNLEKPINDLNRMINRMVFAIIISSMIIGSSLILRTNIGPKIHDISIIGISGFFIAALMGFYLLISILRSGTL